MHVADPDELLRTDLELRKEADEILGPMGLMRVLSAYGEPYIQGSYTLRTMVWRDLDLYLQNDRISEQDFFELGGRIASMLRPTRMSYRDTRKVSIESLPSGLYWGVYANHTSEDSWKIDLWAIDSEQCRKLVRFQEDILERIGPSERVKTLSIKSQVWREAEYRHTFSAIDIYRAVLDYGIEDTAGFLEYLRAERGLVIEIA